MQSQNEAYLMLRLFWKTLQSFHGIFMGMHDDINVFIIICESESESESGTTLAIEQQCVASNFLFRTHLTFCTVFR